MNMVKLEELNQLPERCRYTLGRDRTDWSCTVESLYLSCSSCGTDFIPTLTQLRYFSKDNDHNTFCSPACRKTYDRGRVTNDHPYGNMNTTRLGAMSELVAAADLMARGYEVFRGLDGATSCDLVATKQDTIVRIEVRTGRVLARGKDAGCVYVMLGEKKTITKNIGKFDVLAAVVHGEGVIYFPERIDGPKNSKAVVPRVVEQVNELVGFPPRALRMV